MLKLRTISILAFLLLLVGVNTNVRANIDAEELVQSTDKEQSNKKSQEHEPEQKITNLDFFGAFSLVNVQLQWRDLHVALNDEVTDAESSGNKNELSLEETIDLSLENAEQDAPTTSMIIGEGIAIPVTSYRTANESIDYNAASNTQNESIIAFILNCGTYPKSC